MNCNCEQNAIVIVRNNDSNFNGGKLATINLETEILDLSNFKAVLNMSGVIKTFDDLSSGSIEVNLSAQETKNLPPFFNGVLNLIDSTDKVATIESLIPFKVISQVHGNAIATEPYTLNFDVKQGDETILTVNVESAVTVEVGTTTTLPAGSDATVTNVGTGNHLVLKFGIPQGIQGIPGQDGQDGKDGADGQDGADAKINGVNTLTLTTSYGLNLTQSGSTANISGKEITDIVDGISAVIPSQASESNQLADKAYVGNKIGNGTITINQGGTLKGTFTVNQSGNTTINLDAGGSGGGAVDSVNGQTGVVVLDAEDVGALPDTTAIPTDTSDLTNGAGFITGITSSDVTTALGYTPEQSMTIQTLSATDSITLTDNTIYNGGTQTALTITLPSTVDVSFICEIDFTSGNSPTTLSYSNIIKWAGDDVSNNVFLPVASKRYTTICAYDGVNWRFTVKGVE